MPRLLTTTRVRVALLDVQSNRSRNAPERAQTAAICAPPLHAIVLLEHFYLSTDRPRALRLLREMYNPLMRFVDACAVLSSSSLLSSLLSSSSLLLSLVVAALVSVFVSCFSMLLRVVPCCSVLFRGVVLLCCSDVLL